METFSALLVLCEGNPPVTGGFPSQKPVTRGLDVFFGLRLNKQSGDLRRHRAHYDVTVMIILLHADISSQKVAFCDICHFYCRWIQVHLSYQNDWVYN